jgi:outer membrane protein OmpA-like peptidoglycan-associated protein
MNRFVTGLSIILFMLSCMPAAARQSGQQQQGAQPGNVINISVSRTVPTVNYMSRGSTKVDFVGTALLPRAEGEAKVQAKSGVVNVEAKFEGLPDASSFGPAYLVYVLWAITPEGRATNLGQLVLDGTKSKLLVTTRLQTFGMIVTAEPYFAVSFPSEDVVIANTIRSDTKGAVAPVQANFELLQRGKYASMNLTPLAFDPNVPLDLLQARNAVRIAQLEGAEKYARDSFAKAQGALTRAETYQTGKQKKSVPPTAREAVQAAEDSRTISIKRQEEERIANQQRTAAEQAAQARAGQESEAKQRAQAEEQKAVAERQKAAAERAAAQDAQARAEAEKAQAEALHAQAEAEKARAAAQADAQRQQEAAAQAERDKQDLRAKLLSQFNRVLPTRDTPRGLVVNMGDVLFDTGKSNLRPTAREAVARLAGVVSNYPSLHLDIEGHTDSTGTVDFNQTLSEKRANAVRDFLISQGLGAASLAAVGLGQDNPVADNSTSAGRQQNRRVEIVISGEVIGTKIGPK